MDIPCEEFYSFEKYKWRRFQLSPEIRETQILNDLQNVSQAYYIKQIPPLLLKEMADNDFQSNYSDRPKDLYYWFSFSYVSENGDYRESICSENSQTDKISQIISDIEHKRSTSKLRIGLVSAVFIGME
jgi:hypothetical protein